MRTYVLIISQDRDFENGRVSIGPDRELRRARLGIGVRQSTPHSSRASGWRHSRDRMTEVGGGLGCP